MVGVAPFIAAVAAISAQTSQINNNNSPAHAVARQTTGFDPSNLPPACQSPCLVINTMTNCATSLSCLCTSTIGNNLQTCMDCLVTVVPSVQVDAQSALDAFNEGCAGTGVSSLTLSSGLATSTAATPSAGSPTTGSSTAGTSIAGSPTAAGPTASNPTFGYGNSAPSTSAAGVPTSTGSSSTPNKLGGSAMNLKVGFSLAGAMMTVVVGGLFML